MKNIALLAAFCLLASCETTSNSSGGSGQVQSCEAAASLPTHVGVNIDPSVSQIAFMQELFGTDDDTGYQIKAFKMPNGSTLRSYVYGGTSYFLQIDSGPVFKGTPGYRPDIYIHAFEDLNNDGTLDFILAVDPRTNGVSVPDISFALVGASNQITLAKQNGRPYHSDHEYWMKGFCRVEASVYQMQKQSRSQSTVSTNELSFNGNVINIR